MSGSINMDFKIGKMSNFGYLFITIFLVSVSVILVRIFIINTGVSLEDFARYEILYNMVGAFVGFFLSQYLIKKHKEGLKTTYGRKSVRR